MHELWLNPPEYELLAWIAGTGYKWKRPKEESSETSASEHAENAQERLEAAAAAGMSVIPMTPEALEAMAWANEWDQTHLKGKKP